MDVLCVVCDVYMCDVCVYVFSCVEVCVFACMFIWTCVDVCVDVCGM